MKKKIYKILSALLAVCLLAMVGTSAAKADTGKGLYSYGDLFSSRDLQQTADLTGATAYTLADGQDVRITAAGVYVLSGTAADVTVYVEAGKDDKVQLVLDGVSVTNRDFPAIYVKSADKVFVTTSADSTVSVTGAFASDGDTKTDGVIFSKSDLTLNGTGTLTISSTKNGIISKDDLKITGGVYAVSAASKALQANDSIRIADGELNLVAGTDGLHAENSDDDTLGFIYIGGGRLTVRADDDGIHANSAVQIDNGTVSVTASEGIEATYIQLNGGTISIDAQDDGINAAQKSGAYRATVEINGGDITVAMAAGDTDGVDSNGDIVVNGGTINVTGNSTFDCDGSAQYTGGTIIVNGQQIDYIPNQMMGGRGGWGGQGGQGGKGGRGGRGGW